MTDNANPGGNAVVAMVVRYIGTSFTVLAQGNSAGNGIQTTFAITPNYTVDVGDLIVVRFTTPSATRASSIGTVQVGQLAPAPNTTTTTYNIAFARPATFAGSDSVITNTGGNSIVLRLGTVTTVDDYLPLQIPVGETITGWKVWVEKETSLNTVSFRLRDSDDDAFSTSLAGAVQSSSANNPGVIKLGQSGLDIPVTDGHSFYIAARSGGWDAIGSSDRVLAYAVTTR
ncbi:MAG: hypothetical protein V4515_15180 [Chloroflexota bacterium]